MPSDGKLGVRVGFVRLELNGLRGDRYRLVGFADFQVKVQAAHDIWRDREGRLLDRSKTLGNGFHRVGAGKEVDQAVASAGVRYLLACLTGLSIDDADDGARNNRAALIRDRTDKRTIKNLAISRRLD